MQARNNLFKKIFLYEINFSIIGPTSHESEGGIPRHMMTSLITSPAQPSKLSNKKSENYLIESSNSGVTVKRSAESANSNSSGAHRKLNLGDHEGGGGAGAMATPREPPSGLVSVKNLQCLHALLQIIDYQGNLLDSAWFLVMNTLQVCTYVCACRCMYVCVCSCGWCMYVCANADVLRMCVHM